MAFNLLSRTINDLSSGTPFNFYELPDEITWISRKTGNPKMTGRLLYLNFLTFPEVIDYKNNLANAIYKTKNDFENKGNESDDKARLRNFKTMAIAMMESLLSKEEEFYTNFLNDDSIKNSGVSFQPLNFPTSWDNFDNINKLESYRDSFTKLILLAFVGTLLTTDKNGNSKQVDMYTTQTVTEKANDTKHERTLWEALLPVEDLDPSNYDNFLYILDWVSRHGGITAGIKGDAITEEEKTMTNWMLKNLLRNKTELSKEAAKVLKENIKRTFNYKETDFSDMSSIASAIYQNWSSLLLNSGKKTVLEKDFNSFFSYYCMPMITLLNKRFGNKISKKYKDSINAIIFRKEHWEKFYDDLRRTGFLNADLTTVSLNEIWLRNNIKGSYGEMITSVLALHKGIKAIYNGTALDVDDGKVSSEQSITDTIIIVNGKAYGIQVKELSFLDQKGFNNQIQTNLYQENETIDFGNSGTLLSRYFSDDAIKKLASLLELYADNSLDTRRLLTIFLHLNIELLRILNYVEMDEEGQKRINKILEDESKDVKNSALGVRNNIMYRITGYYYPASYILYRRLVNIFSTLRRDDEDGGRHHIQLKNYRIGEINMKSTGNILPSKTNDFPLIYKKRKGHVGLFNRTEEPSTYSLEILSLEDARAIVKCLSITRA